MIKSMKISERICQLTALKQIHGDITMEQLLEVELQESMARLGKPFKCAKCHGKGTVSVKYNAYPTGLPDSGWVDDWQYKDVQCDLCKGVGWTEKEYKPKMVQEGWE